MPQQEGLLVVAGASRQLIVPHLGKVPASPVLGGLVAPAAGHQASLLGVPQPGEIFEPGGLEGALELLQQGLGARERELLDGLAFASSHAAALRFVPAIAARAPAAAAAAAFRPAAVAQARPLLLVLAAVAQGRAVLHRLLPLQRVQLQLHGRRPAPIEMPRGPRRGLGAPAAAAIVAEPPAAAAAAEGQSPTVPLGEQGAPRAAAAAQRAGAPRVRGQQRLLGVVGGRPGGGLQGLGLQALQFRFLVGPPPIGLRGRGRRELSRLRLRGPSRGLPAGVIVRGAAAAAAAAGGDQPASSERQRPAVHLTERHGARRRRPVLRPARSPPPPPPPPRERSPAHPAPAAEPGSRVGVGRPARAAPGPRGGHCSRSPGGAAPPPSELGCPDMKVSAVMHV